MIADDYHDDGDHDDDDATDCLMIFSLCMRLAQLLAVRTNVLPTYVRTNVLAWRTCSPSPTAQG